MNAYALMILVAGMGQAAREEVLEGFQYADSAAAARVWRAAEGSPPPSVVQDDGRPVLELKTPFQSQPGLSRSVIDRSIKQNLAAPGQFALELYVPDPEAAGHITLYFRSGSGWYAGGADPWKKGWQTLRFSKAGFRVEGKPAGWHLIDGIRISIWRQAPKDSSVRFRSLVALSGPLALVIPGAGQDPRDRELRTAHTTAEAVGDMLGEIGLEADAVEQTALGHGALEKRRVAILAYNPQLDEQAAAVLEDFVNQGGKLLVCYQLPPRLGKVLGFGRPRHIRPAQPDQFAEIRFEAPDIPGLPAAVRQASWNITAAEPTSPEARVIARWFDAQGKPTGHPAVLLSPSGAFITHIILTDDREGKKQMLAALLGHLDPSLWPPVVQSELDRLSRIGHLEGLDELSRYVARSKQAAAADRLQTGLGLVEAARKRASAGDHPAALEQLRKARQVLVEAYLRATPSRADEGRAFWNHSGTGAYPGDWERTAKELAAGGFNMVLPNMLWGGLAHYASDLLPRSSTFDKHGDQIAQCVAAAHRHGIEVHVWKVNYNLANAPRDFLAKLRAQGRTQVSASGEPVNWLCPSHPENLKLELESMLEVARKYEVDGLHFDYIRYPDGDCCYCEGCRQRFEGETGTRVAAWPADCYKGARRAEYRQWRCRQITRLVEAVHREAKRLRPGLKISAAVFGSYPACRESVGQDWPAWIKAGLLDFVCPMDYTESDLAFSALVSNQLKLVEGRIPAYPGIGATASRSTLSPDRVVGQVHQARWLGAAGFTVFNLDRNTIAQIVPAVGLGAGSQRAVPPHKSGKN
ncbi:MAG: glycoside hydrolase family 10 protein [Thermoguttaceae bacterium]